MEQDEEGTLHLVDRDLMLLTKCCAKHGGEVLKNTGDGLLMIFESAHSATESAVEMLETLIKQNTLLPANERLQHRLGLHIGDIFIRGNDVLGDGVNVAARIMGVCEPGSVYMSQTVYDLLQPKFRARAKSVGTPELKNIHRPIRVYQIFPEGIGTPTAGDQTIRDSAESSTIPASEATVREATSHRINLYLEIDGQRFLCQPGDILGRHGTVAKTYIEAYETVSRRHVEIGLADGCWFIKALSTSNRTQLDEKDMITGVGMPLTTDHWLRMSSKCEVRLLVREES